MGPFSLAKNTLRKTSWQFIILAIGMTASVVLAAMRTGFQFYLSSHLTAVKFLGGSSSIIDLYSILEAAVTMIGIEGLMVAFGVINGHKTGKTRIDAKWIIGLNLSISVLAGLGQSFELITNLPENISFILQWLLALVTGAGVSVLSYFAAEYFGVLLAGSKVDEKQWLADAWKAWMHSRERRMWMLELGIQPEHRLPTPAQELLEAPADFPSARDLIIDYAQRHGLTNLDSISATQVASEAYQQAGKAPHNGDLGKLAGSIRVALTRERKRSTKLDCGYGIGGEAGPCLIAAPSGAILSELSTRTPTGENPVRETNMKLNAVMKGRLGQLVDTGGAITAREAADMLRVINELETRNADYTRLIEMQQVRIAKASKVFKRARNWPEEVFPDLGELIDWLLDRSGRKEAELYRKSLTSLQAILEDIRPAGWDQACDLKGRQLVELRLIVSSALSAAFAKTIPHPFPAQEMESTLRSFDTTQEG